MKWTNNLTNIFQTNYPLIQAPMFGVTTPKMVAAAAKVNCLGSLPLGDLEADKCRELIRETSQLTNKPFAINIFVHRLPEITDVLKEKYKETKQFITQLAREHAMEISLPEMHEIEIKSYHEQIEVVIEENCKLLSFTFGNLAIADINKLKSNHVTLIGTCTSVDEAIMLEKSGIDIICVQGIEAGGHGGSFSDEYVPKIGGLSLLAQVYDSVKRPIIYAGGIYNAPTLLAAKTLGAQGFQTGSLLLGSQESALLDFEKQRLRDLTEHGIVLTKSFSGRLARGIKNAFTEALDKTELILPYPLQNKLTNGLRKKAKANSNADFVSIWVGQSINGYSGESTADILQKLIDAAELSSS